jgi:hypothetical protein
MCAPREPASRCARELTPYDPRPLLACAQRDGCPKIVNLGSSKTDLFYERKKCACPSHAPPSVVVAGHGAASLACSRVRRLTDGPFCNAMCVAAAQIWLQKEIAGGAPSSGVVPPSHEWCRPRFGVVAASAVCGCRFAVQPLGALHVGCPSLVYGPLGGWTLLFGGDRAAEAIEWPALAPP